MPGRPDPECNSDGTYAPSQCLGVLCMCVHADSGLPGMGSQHFIWDDQFDCSAQQWEYSAEFDPVEGMQKLGGKIIPIGGDSGSGDESESSDGDKKMPDGDKKMPDGDKQMPDGDKQMPDGDKQMPDGDKQMPDGDKQMPDGDKQMPDGDKQMPDGDKQMPDGDTDDDKYMEGPKPFLGNSGGMN